MVALSALGEAIAGFALGYVIASLLESYLHEKINDAPKRVVRKWRRFPRLLSPLIETNFSHHVIHHVRTYRKDHVTQFSSAEEKAALDEQLSQTRHGRAVMRALYGATFSPKGWVAFCAPLVPVSIAATLLAGPWFGLGALVATFIPPFMSNWVHPYLHMSHEDAVAAAPAPLSWFLRTRYMRFVARHHFLHHRYCNRNFNLTLGGDWLRGRVRKARERDIREMQRVGLRLD